MNSKEIVVIGCGIFGAELALKLKRLGFSVSIYEANSFILGGASANNQNRLHLGFHYPRDLQTGIQCIRGFDAFKNKYAQCIEHNFKNAYFISDQNSRVTYREYLNFCDQLGILYKEISKNELPVKLHGASYGVLCDEVVYDCNLLRGIIMTELNQSGIEIHLSQKITGIAKESKKFKLTVNNERTIRADVVINTTYADVNRLTGQLGYSVEDRLYEYTVIPIISLDIDRVGLTIMDGDFMTLLPYGKTNFFLLYHVVYSVVASDVCKQIDEKWLGQDTFLSSQAKLNFSKKILQESSKFLPCLKQAHIVGYLQGPRMVLAHRESSDSRPSIVNTYEDNYLTIMAGKIDHSIWVADEVASLILSKD